jgi:hypothetical protein
MNQEGRFIHISSVVYLSKENAGWRTGDSLLKREEFPSLLPRPTPNRLQCLLSSRRRESST